MQDRASRFFMMEQSNSSRIAKNTIFLYIRSIIVLLVTLYTSRVVLRVLGVSDYGIYNVVGGVISMIGFLNTSMVATYQRFFNYEMGRKNDDGVIAYFRSATAVQLLISALIVVIGETLGLWFVNSQLTIPDGRMIATNWVYQAAIVSFVLMMFQAPYGAMIIAYEKMNIFAFISILDVFLRLGIVFLIQQLPGDKLIAYAFMLSCVSLVDFALYIAICKTKLSIGKFKILWDKSRIKELLGFSSWGMLDSLALSVKSQGLNILLNMFFGPIINAARGIAYQVLSATKQFVSNFQTAFRPQLMKSYAEGDYDYMYQLFYSATKISFYLILCLSLPIILETPILLHIWLGDNVPDHTSAFVILVLLTSWVDVFSSPVTSLAYATGRIKKFNLVVSGMTILILPASWFFLRLGFSPESTMVVSLVITVLSQGARMIIIKDLLPFSIKQYATMVLSPTIMVLVMSVVIPLFIHFCMDYGFLRLIVVLIVTELSILGSVWFLGTSCNEKELIINRIRKVIE